MRPMQGQSAKPLNVLLVEDDRPIREEFARMVEADAGLRLLAATSNCSEARQAAARTWPDVALIDLGLPDGDGTDLVAELAQPSRGQVPTHVIVVTVFGDESHVVRALSAGAHGYLLKDTPLAEFSQAIRMVVEGASPISPQVARHLLKRFTGSVPTPRNAPLEPLTDREQEVLRLVSQGFSGPEVARRMGVAPSTVTTHVKGIYGKLSVHSRIEAVNRARAHGLL
jgi:DNA-binding NarL/FixJ family response regulator